MTYKTRFILQKGVILKPKNNYQITLYTRGLCGRKCANILTVKGTVPSLGEQSRTDKPKIRKLMFSHTSWSAFILMDLRFKCSRCHKFSHQNNALLSFDCGFPGIIESNNIGMLKTL